MPVVSVPITQMLDEIKHEVADLRGLLEGTVLARLAAIEQRSTMLEGRPYIANGERRLAHDEESVLDHERRINALEAQSDRRSGAVAFGKEALGVLAAFAALGAVVISLLALISQGG
jgi:hypothetical protein